MSLTPFSARLSGHLIYGDAITTEHATLIPVTRERGQASTAVGMFVVRADGATWVPVVDADRIALIGVTTGFVAATLGCLAVLRKPPWAEGLIRISRDSGPAAD